jgi:DNA-binding NarL/FixJ family response regulator
MLGDREERKMDKPRVLLAEDHSVVREGTRGMLERDGSVSVVGEAADGPSAVALARQLAPDVVLLDIGLPLLNGIDATRQIKALPKPPRILILTAYDDAAYARAAFEAGANGYLVKTATMGRIIQAIHAVASGQVVLDEAVARGFLTRLDATSREGLSEREMEVLGLAAQGIRNREIGERLMLSTRTVEAHFTSIFNKLGVSSRTEAVTHVIARGWLVVRRDQPPT